MRIRTIVPRRQGGRTLIAVMAGVWPALVAAQADTAPTPLDTITVTDSADFFRYRSESVSPRLIYDAAYFSRFEPLSVGDMLKQVPGVAFTSDVGEYDAPQLRGIGTQYTQILINGERVAGAGDDRSVFVDRIPAELVERIEIIRAPTGDLDAQGIGGTINIVLRNAGEFSGGQYRSGLYRSGDDTLRGSGYLGYGGQSGRFSYMGALNYQGRYNAKDKRETLYDADGNLIAFAQEDDVRDSRDLAGNLRLSWLLTTGGTFSVDGYSVGTQRDEDQFSPNFEVEDGVAELDAIEFEHEDIEENSHGLALSFMQPFGEARFNIVLDYNRFDVDIDNVAGEVEDDVEIALETETIDTDDTEMRLSPSFELPLGLNDRLHVGLDLARKARDAATRTAEFDEDSGEFEDETKINGVYEIREERFDAFAQYTWTLNARHAIDAGLRLETTELEQEGLDSDGQRREADDSQTELNPNLHYRWLFTANDQIRASVARTVRRPDFSALVPFLEEDDGEFFIGNPELEPETAIGYDLGYEHRFADQAGIVGVNLFYRDVSDLIEVVEIEDDVESPSNTGDGEVYGIEFDASFPLVMLGLPGVNVYGNYSYQKSEITDPFTGQQRRFQLQPVYVFNLGFTHKLPQRITWGASFQKQGRALEYESDEIADVRYDGNLEAFVEYQISENLWVKLNGTNLLDAHKDETFRVFDDDLPDGQLEEFEVETESVGRIAILTLRGRF
ncbi:TonB-dependent receptor plug domain-containing protein [Sinimarinibacterium flocculans]|uniref:TonB-dependent receptor plug domain-containing protein n=1 Tax=Sinimarinibacterium flocculans TaxID=985250 RepID=UPI0035149CF9